MTYHIIFDRSGAMETLVVVWDDTNSKVTCTSNGLIIEVSGIVKLL